MKLNMKAKDRFQNFPTDEGGTLTIWSTIFMVAALAIGGFAVDTSNAWRIKAALQHTAEASALAAAVYIEDADKAKKIAVDFARLNMPPSIHGHVVGFGDVEIGTYDGSTGVFLPTNENPDAVRVFARRDKSRANAVSTYLFRLAGVNEWDVGRSAIGFPRWGTRDEIDCSGATIITAGYVEAGESNTLVEGVCVHGETGVDTGGDAFFDGSVQFSSSDLLNIVFGSVRVGSVQPEALIVQQTKELSVLPSLDLRFQELWDELYGGGIDHYSGSRLPDFIFDANTGLADVVRIDGDFKPKSGEFRENTIYMVNGNVKMNGGASAQNIAIIATGSIGGGGGKATYQNVFFFGEQDLKFAGSVSWGDQTNYCDSGQYNTYLLSKTHLTLGAKSNNSSTHGVVGAAPSFNPGGGLKNTGGLYIETEETITKLNGGIEITNACEKKLNSFLQTTTFSEEARVIGSSLRR